MFSADHDPDSPVAAVVLVLAIVLAVGLVLGMVVHRAHPHSVPRAPLVRPAAVPVPFAAGESGVAVEAGVVTFYFASGKAELAAGAMEALRDVMDVAKGGKPLLISGFHDETGDPDRNADLARRRAFAVRDALLAAGVAETRLELRKPAQTAGQGRRAEARRVEVVIVE